MTTADELIANAKALLLDFDGPVTALMPPPANAEAAAKARRPLADVSLPDEVRATTDHLAVLRWTSTNATSRLDDVERACTEAEVACARTSEPSPEIRRLLDVADVRSIPVAIVSNNSEEAVRVFLDRYAWAHRIATCACRTPQTSRLLKPNPFLVRAATELLDIPSSDCVFIGDSTSDVEAGRAAGVIVVGLAKTVSRGDQLRIAGAHALIAR